MRSLARDIRELLTLPDDARLSADDAGILLGNFSAETIMTWRCRRIGPRYSKIGGRVTYRVGDLRAYVRAHKIDPQEAQGAEP